MKLRPVLLLVVVFILSAVAGWFGRGLPFSQQWSYFDSLRTTASIVFGVMGAWITILYPKALESVLSIGRGSSDSGHDERIQALLLPVKLSTFVIAVVLLIGPCALMLKQLAWSPEWIEVLRGGAFGLLIFLTLLELAAVVLTLWPVDVAIGEIDAAKHKKEERKSMFKLTRKASQ